MGTPFANCLRMVSVVDVAVENLYSAIADVTSTNDPEFINRVTDIIKGVVAMRTTMPPKKSTMAPRKSTFRPRATAWPPAESAKVLLPKPSWKRAVRAVLLAHGAMTVAQMRPHLGFETGTREWENMKRRIHLWNELEKHSTNSDGTHKTSGTTYHMRFQRCEDCPGDQKKLNELLENYLAERLTG